MFVSSPGNQELDQELDDCMVGPVPVGVNSFEFEASPPNSKIIPREDVLGAAAVILTGSYRDQEFVRVGYYQNTEYDIPEWNDSPPEGPIQFDRLVRTLMKKPRVTRFQIKWCAANIRRGKTY
jgi:histone chaperone ASF1